MALKNKDKDKVFKLSKSSKDATSHIDSPTKLWTSILPNLLSLPS